MRPLIATAMLAFALLPLRPAAAQELLSAAPAQAGTPRPLQPFVASYQVFHGGDELGIATLQVVPLQDDRWRVDLVMKGKGLMRLTGLNLEQSTLFERDGEDYRPLTQATVRRAFLSRRRTVGVYDWATGSAHWTGDVRKGRAGPVALQDGDMSGLLIDLALVRDAEPGSTLRYRFVDDGRARDHLWIVAPQTEAVTVDGLSYDAMRADRQQDGGDETTIWVADGVPTPIRILQREDGEDSTDLRLIAYKGAMP
ncbi:MAG TPA: DUF3108 domain-containing protein [Xanthomonadaceae bacterium]|nr:DUF3108 domain-containing protein [Xanthomonadaceae bacterium]